MIMIVIIVIETMVYLLMMLAHSLLLMLLVIHLEASFILRSSSPSFPYFASVLVVNY